MYGSLTKWSRFPGVSPPASSDTIATPTVPSPISNPTVFATNRAGIRRELKLLEEQILDTFTAQRTFQKREVQNGAALRGTDAEHPCPAKNGKMRLAHGVCGISSHAGCRAMRSLVFQKSSRGMARRTTRVSRIAPVRVAVLLTARNT